MTVASFCSVHLDEGHEQVISSAKQCINALSEGVRPAFSESTGLKGLEASAGTAASHAVGDTMAELMDNDVVGEGTVAVGLVKNAQ